MSDAPICPVQGCLRKLPRAAIMCGGCWRRLPDDIRHQYRRDVAEYFEARSERRKDDEASLARMSLALQAAQRRRDAAIEAARFARFGHETIPPDLRGRTYRPDQEAVS